MSYKLFTFKCTRCEKIQEQLISNSDHKPEDACIDCDALPDQLERIITISGLEKHLSWSKWRAT